MGSWVVGYGCPGVSRAPGWVGMGVVGVQGVDGYGV